MCMISAVATLANMRYDMYRSQTDFCKPIIVQGLGTGYIREVQTGLVSTAREFQIGPT